MKKTYLLADNIVSPLGFTSEENWNSLLEGSDGIKLINKDSITKKNFYGALVQDDILENSFAAIASPLNYTRLEKMYIISIREASKKCEVDLTSDRTLFILSSTKGNIDLLVNSESKINTERVSLFAMAGYISSFFGNPNEPVVISNACISGVIALNTASYFIREGLYDHVVVAGGDIISEFTVSGFLSLFALSQGHCKPFDKSRDGINLGEACATIILSSNAPSTSELELKAGATSNDANHISGPSKTGDGLSQSIEKTLQYAGLTSADIGYISAHGTATAYNDEMEAKALNSAGLGEVSVNSLKGYFGHTLGAAGVLETVIASWSLRKQFLISSIGYKEHGVSLPLQVIRRNESRSFTHCLKTASGFGGCNASLILSKND